MARTNSDLVGAIIELDSEISIDQFITTANVLTSWLSSQDTDSLLSTSLLSEIERYLAAHFYSHYDQLYSAKSTGQASAFYQGKTEMVLSSTMYGQTAMLLDVTGILAQRSKEAERGGKIRSSAVWLGTPADSYPRPDGGLVDSDFEDM